MNLTLEIYVKIKTFRDTSDGTVEWDINRRVKSKSWNKGSSKELKKLFISILSHILTDIDDLISI